MYNLNRFIILFVIAAVANGQDSDIDDYINLNRQKYNKTIKDMDTQMNMFKQANNASLKTINIKLNLLIDTIAQTNQKLDQLSVLNNLSEICVPKYRQTVPSIKTTTLEINACVATAKSKLSNLLDDSMSTRNNLEIYYKETFEKNIVGCQKLTTSRYIICILNAVQDAENFTNSSKKKFDTQIYTAHSFGNSYIIDSLGCSYTTEDNVISSCSQAYTLINKCVLGQDNCTKCSKGFTCSEVFQLKKTEYESIYSRLTIPNPFYKSYIPTNCLMLQLV